MQIFVIALALISSALVAVEAYLPPVRQPPPCYNKCMKIPNFPGRNCTNLEIYVYDACSYSCNCNGPNGYFYGVYQEDDLKTCGKNKVCWNGYCTDVAQDGNCEKYGDCYVPISNSYQPCIYQCVHKSGCDVYEENKPSGSCCYNQGCLRTGKCDKGTCNVKGGIGCSRRYYWYGPFLGLDSKEGSSTPAGGSSSPAGRSSTPAADKVKPDPKEEAIASAATGQKYDPDSDNREFIAAYSAAKALSKCKERNGPKYDREMSKRIAKKFCESDNGDKKSNEKAFAKAYREARGCSDGSEQSFGKSCAEEYNSWSH